VFNCRPWPEEAQASCQQAHRWAKNQKEGVQGRSVPCGAGQDDVLRRRKTARLLNSLSPNNWCETRASGRRLEHASQKDRSDAFLSSTISRRTAHKEVCRRLRVERLPAKPLPGCLRRLRVLKSSRPGTDLGWLRHPDFFGASTSPD
jgi:hypothetical protein